MSYQVLARKYRPQRFDEVVGQGHITTTLRNALASGRLHHAYLFTGARGIGKTTVARILAKALNCKNLKDFEPCGKCGPCVEITNGSSMDIQEIDGASNTSVEDVREIRERVKYMPSSAKYKIYIIDEVHMLSNSAFNALLKTLEEPPAHVIFIFATTESHKIPATILSRCQRYDFRRIPQGLIVGTLAKIAGDEKIKIDDESLRMIAHEATGSLRDAESLFDQAIAFSGEGVTAKKIKEMLGTLDRSRLFELTSALLARDPKNALDMLDSAFEGGTDLVRFAMDILEILRHMLILAECGDERGAIDLPPDEISLLKGLSGKTSAPELHRMFSLWYGVADGIARSPFPKMLLEVGLIRLCRVGAVKNVEDVIARIDAVIGNESLGREPKPHPRQEAVLQRPEMPKGQTPGEGIEAKTSESVSLSFEPAGSPADAEAEKKWQEFMRWVVVQKPQVASILQHGVLVGIDDGIVKLSFNNPLYADMLSEDARKVQVEGFFESFFKRKMSLAVGKNADAPVGGEQARKKKELMREALGNDIVRKAADVLNARLYDVKVDGEENQ